MKATTIKVYHPPCTCHCGARRVERLERLEIGVVNPAHFVREGVEKIKVVFHLGPLVQERVEIEILEYIYVPVIGNKVHYILGHIDL